MNQDHEAKPASTDARAHIQTAVPKLAKALQALQGDCTDADIRIAAGQSASAARALRRACEALNTAPARSTNQAKGG